MGRPRLSATSVERKVAWRRRQRMAVRPHYPSAAAKQAAYRVRQRQAAQVLAARECAAIQQALQTRARADECWELHALIDDWSRDADMPHHVSEGRPSGLVAGVSTSFYGMAAARGRRHRRALQRLAHVRATRAVQACAPRDTGSPCASARGARPHTAGGQPLPTMDRIFSPFAVQKVQKLNFQGGLSLRATVF
jgi:ribosomal protein L21E